MTIEDFVVDKINWEREPDAKTAGCDENEPVILL